MPTASRQVHATPDDVFSVLADYEHYEDWSPDVVAATVLAREGDVVVAEFLSPFLVEGKYILEFVHSRPSTIIYRQVDQHESRGLQGSWSLAATADTSVTIVTGQMDFRTEIWRRAADRRRAERILQRRFDALQGHVSSAARRGDGRAAVEPQQPDPALFDALEKGQALTVWASDIECRFTRVDP
jgi:ribosome-associated toxin RatA of RatAB toxin-antitoxin module